MPANLVIGAQWGDEGKGKIIDVIAQQADYVIRYHGGNNAGHTIINSYGKFAMHLVPSGIFHKNTVGVIANGTVLDLNILASEIKILENAGISLKNRLLISPRCHLIMPYHQILDRVYEKAKGKGKTGTTGRGIGPVYADKVSYNGIRLSDLSNKEVFREKLKVQLTVKNKILKALGEKQLLQKEIEDAFFALFEKIKNFVTEPYPILQVALQKNKLLLFEGAQGVFLDNDWGTYPFATASSTLSGGITAGSGIAPAHIDRIIGVVKAYTTRVGDGPFPTELLNETGENLRAKGGEFGATTGRPRRCGWLDVTLLRFAVQLNGFTDIAITKLDILTGFTEIYICTGYTMNGKMVNYFDGDTIFFSKVKPVYKKMSGWKKSVAGITKYEDLPNEAKTYVSEIEKLAGTKVSFISTGPKRHEIITR